MYYTVGFYLEPTYQTLCLYDLTRAAVETDEAIDYVDAIGHLIFVVVYPRHSYKALWLRPSRTWTEQTGAEGFAESSSLESHSRAVFGIGALT
jgi:hypothetical protein